MDKTEGAVALSVGVAVVAEEETKKPGDMGLSSTVQCPKCDQRVDEDLTVVTKAKKKVCRNCYSTMLCNHARKQLMSLRIQDFKQGSPTEKVLISYDSSFTSVALINLCHEAVMRNDEVETNPRQLPFPFEFSILVILEPVALVVGRDLKNQMGHLECLLRWCEWAKKQKPGQEYRVYVTSLEMSLSSTAPKIRRIMHPEEVKQSLGRATEAENGIQVTKLSKVKAPFDEEASTKLAGFVFKLPSLTLASDLRNVLRWNLFKLASTELGIGKVFLSDDKNIAGSNMLSMVSLGRGAQVAPKMSINEQWSGLSIGRPLLDFLTQELKSYLSNIPVENLHGLYTNPGRDISKHVDTIQQKCAEFIGQLDKDFPATVSTLAGIGTKLDSAEGPEGPKKLKKGKKGRMTNGHPVESAVASGSKGAAAGATGISKPKGKVSTAATTSSSGTDSSPRFLCAVCKGAGEPVSKEHPDCCYGCVQLLNQMGCEEVKWVRGLGELKD